MDVFGDVLYNLYGSTEGGVVSIAVPSELRRDPTCAGQPAARTMVVVLDPSGNPLPAGNSGRIFVGSDMIFDGYTSDDTAQVMRDGWVSTGDVGHLSEDGLLHIDGRADDMIVSGGENVYPTTVEDVIAELPQVQDVAVAGVPDPEWGQRLAAWIVLYPGEHLDPEAVREYVRRTLARFSVPRDVRFVDALPRNASGKIVRRHLTQTPIPAQRPPMVDPSAPTAPIPRVQP
jgi:acyl-CoA synthetase (AMP-forming)/AMP-acid ligase II